MKRLAPLLVSLCSIAALGCEPKTLPACTFPSLEMSDGGGGCRSARLVMSCTEGDITQECLGDDLAAGCDTTFTSCQSRCEYDEYGVVCSDVSTREGCRSLGATPGGTMFFCCPCTAPALD